MLNQEFVKLIFLAGFTGQGVLSKDPTVWLDGAEPQPVSFIGPAIEMGLEQAPFIFLFFSAFEHVKSLLIMGPNNTKNSSLKCDFLTINYE